MIFNQLLYPLFLLVTVGVFFLLPQKLRPWWIFFTGAAFYGYYATAFLLLFLVEIVAVYFLAKNVRSSRRAYLAALAITLGLLAYYKYTGMAVIGLSQMLTLFDRPGLPSFERLVLPLAISFFTFEFVHYIVDSRQGKIGEHRLEDFLAFSMFFPTMVAGPIKRFQDFVPKMHKATLAAENVNAGATRILVGFAKKIVIADTMSLWVQPLNSSAGVSGASRGVLWTALIAYSIKIYMDFSGYSDIAIGSARLFGVKVPENFSWPYLRTNIASFWRHWHMSLTAWITDYVYIPLGGSRGALGLTAVNTMLALSVSGLWHGADWHFVAWGLYHGALLAAYRVYSVKLKPLVSPHGRDGLKLARRKASGLWRVGDYVGKAFGMALTFTLVTIGWGLFIMPVGRFGVLLARLF